MFRTNLVEDSAHPVLAVCARRDASRAVSLALTGGRAALDQRGTAGVRPPANGCPPGSNKAVRGARRGPSRGCRPAARSGSGGASMLIGDILVSQGLVTRADIAAALERQTAHGGLLGDNLIALGKLRLADLEAVMQAAPPAPRSIEETGLPVSDLLNLLAKSMYSGNSETPSKLSDVLKLPPRTVQLIIEQAKERKLLD